MFFNNLATSDQVKNLTVVGYSKGESNRIGGR